MSATVIRLFRPSILVIDDDDPFREFVAEVLQEEGYSVRQAPGGDTGWALFRAKVPDLVLTDIVMPQVEGIELIRMIGASAHPRPVVAMSAGGMRAVSEDYLRMARLLGAAAVLRKPFTSQLLLEIVTTLLKVS